MLQTLFTPGPTPVPSQVLDRMSQPILHHRSDEAKQIFSRVHEGLQKVFLTHEPVLILSSSGTGAVESAMTSLCSVGDTAIVLSNGKFAARWATMLRVFGLNVIEVLIEWGQPATLEHLAPALADNSTCTSVWIVQSETSTGVHSNIKELSDFVHQHSDALVCVDGVSSVCAHEIRMDDWGIDVLTTGSQKGLMLPPGLGFVSLSKRAWRATTQSNIPKYYFDLRKALKSYEENSTPWTPAITLVCGLDTSLNLIFEEGLENVWRRHAEFTNLVRNKLSSGGFEMFSQSPSHAVTSVCIPPSKPDIVKALQAQFGIRVASGQEQLKSRIFRVGHLGYYSLADIHFVTDSLLALI